MFDGCGFSFVLVLLYDVQVQQEREQYVRRKDPT